MGALERFLRRLGGARPPAPSPAVVPPAMPTRQEEGSLWAVLRDDPNDVPSFHALAEIVRRRAEEGHQGTDPRKAADDAVWALAEELAHSGRAWYPLVELGRLSVHDDREQALRRLATAADRDSSGIALATAVGMLRDEGLPAAALNLGVGHWRPREHDVEAGRQLVLAAIDAGRYGEARRNLEALAGHPDAGQVAPIRAELQREIEDAERNRPAVPGTGPIPVVDIRERKIFRKG
jgi:hypothetical protein